MNSPAAWQWMMSITAPALAGFVGVLTGAWLTSLRERRQRRHAFVERQLQDLYSPLLGLRSEIQYRSQLRVRISSAADVAWKRLCDETRNARDPIEAFERLEQGRGDEFKSMIDYDNRQLAEEVIPAYRRMLTVFRDNLWLAEPETRTYFEVLLEFVELWERWLAQSIPYEVVQALEHSEARLHPFYAHLAAKHDELRKRLCQI